MTHVQGIAEINVEIKIVYEFSEPETQVFFMNIRGLIWENIYFVFTGTKSSSL